MSLLKFYALAATTSAVDRIQGIEEFFKRNNGDESRSDLNVEVVFESCYYVLLSSSADTSSADTTIVNFLLSQADEGDVNPESNLVAASSTCLIEVGPRLCFATAFSTNAVSAFHSAGLAQVTRVEKSRRICISVTKRNGNDYKLINIADDLKQQIGETLYDRMTECVYEKELNFSDFVIDIPMESKSFFEIDVLNGGKSAVQKASTDLGLGFDEFDMEFYYDLFVNKAKRNPTNVELFDLAQSNSEHSRHWFFKGRMILDGVEQELSLIDMIINTQSKSNENNLIKFTDNSSAIVGTKTDILIPTDVSVASSYQHKFNAPRHIIYTAETHNFPTGICPFPGAATGTGGRIRDVQATGRGAHVVAGISAYSFGNLRIPGFVQPWEDDDITPKYPPSFANPLQIAIEASNGASDYGNKFGEPVVCGFARSFGMQVGGTRIEYVKPIMFSGGIGAIDGDQLMKLKPEIDFLVVKLGGPIYRIGVGGGAASSTNVQGDDDKLDFGAVQRGDAEMEQKLNRVIRSCVELGAENPILSIHDQGAGGNGNVLKEIVEGAGAKISASNFSLGDPTISLLELWGAEYQESNAVLIRDRDRALMETICARERCPIDVVGVVTGDNRIVLEAFGKSNGTASNGCKKSKPTHPVDLDLDLVLGKVPRKTFDLQSVPTVLQDFTVSSDVTLMSALERVLKLPSVASKRYLTNKVDRSVTGLVAQQPCVGPLHTPLADVAVTALSHFDTVGSAVAVGEQPIKMLVCPSAGARMSLAEALTNLVFAPVTCLKDVKCSGNWMWPAKGQPEQGARLYKACDALCALMNKLGVAIDGGKDSLSMAAKIDKNEVVNSPGTLVISCYAPCTDITKVVTPDLKCPKGEGALIYVRFGSELGVNRLGGSALAQCYRQLGSCSPDIDNADYLINAFQITQRLINDLAVTAGHDISDGGLLVCLLEMAFAGNCSLDIEIPDRFQDSFITFLFAEEAGIVIEVPTEQLESVVTDYQSANVPCIVLGHSLAPTGPSAKIVISCAGEAVLSDGTSRLRSLWEECSYELDKYQTALQCAEAEYAYIEAFTTLNYQATSSQWMEPIRQFENRTHKVAVIREEGSNGDREMASAFYMAGFEVWDVCMQDLLTGKFILDGDFFRGVAFVGGFSYGDVLGSAKGWAAAILFHETLRKQFDAFRNRKNTFSFGACNGCQLMTLLGWVGDVEPDMGHEQEQKLTSKIRMVHNKSGRYESRFSTVKIEQSPAIMFDGMEQSVLGVWVAHGEGRFCASKGSDQLVKLQQNHLVPLSFVDSEGLATEAYPSNPNGSPLGIAGLCSSDGRHLALMPHPERSFLSWQWPYYPSEQWPVRSEQPRLGNEKEGTWNRSGPMGSPWIQMFKNAAKWCDGN